MEIHLTPEYEHTWGLLKRDNRTGYFDTLAASEVQETRPPGSRRYTTQFGQILHTPAGLKELQSHKVAKHMAVAHLTPPQRAQYEAGTLNVYVVDELGRKHWLMHAKPGIIGLRKS